MKQIDYNFLTSYQTIEVRKEHLKAYKKQAILKLVFWLSLSYLIFLIIIWFDFSILLFNLY